MRNLYFTILVGEKQENLNALIEKFPPKSLYPHENFHYLLSPDETQAIIQANFEEDEISWLKAQPYVVDEVGEFKRGAPEKKVQDYLEARPDKWKSDRRDKAPKELIDKK